MSVSLKEIENAVKAKISARKVHLFIYNGDRVSCVAELTPRAAILKDGKFSAVSLRTFEYALEKATSFIVREA